MICFYFLPNSSITHSKWENFCPFLPLQVPSTDNQNKNYVSYNFLLSLLCLSMLTILWLQSHISRAKLCLLLTLNPWSDKLLLVQAVCDSRLHSLIKITVLLLLFETTANSNDYEFYFILWLWSVVTASSTHLLSCFASVSSWISCELN